MLVPQPSDDVNDPLNWPKWKKVAAFIPIVCFAGPGTAIVLIMKAFHIDLEETVNGIIGYTILTLGLGVISPDFIF
jgi:hypothetical protein